MNKLIERVTALVDVKSLITFGLVGTVCFLAIRQNTPLSSEVFATTIGSVITYFFTKKKSGGENNVNTSGN